MRESRKNKSKGRKRKMLWRVNKKGKKREKIIPPKFVLTTKGETRKGKNKLNSHSAGHPSPRPNSLKVSTI